MSFELITRGAPEDRRSLPLNPSATPTILAGQVLQKDPATGFAVLADGAAVVPDPMWAFTKTARLDVGVAKSITVVEAPFLAKVNADGYVGTPAAGNALVIDTGANKGKLKVQAVAAVADLQAVVAYCVKAPDANGVIEIKAIR